MRLRRLFPLLGLLLACSLVGCTTTAADEFDWNAKIPEKRPAAKADNGKLVLFDVSHGGTEGNADWVIDGAFSRFADELVRRGYTVREYRGKDLNGDGKIVLADDRRPDADRNKAKNEAIIALDAIERADVFVMAESNRPLRLDEYAALKAFVGAGKGLFLIGDHYNADRDYDGWDSTEVFNGYNRSDDARFRMAAPYGDYRNPKDAAKGWLAETFGVRFRFNAIDFKFGASDVVDPEQAEGITQNVGRVLIAAGATLAIVDPKKAKGIIYLARDDGVESWSNAVEGPTKGLYFGGKDEGPFVAISKPGKGKAAFIGDSSPIEDPTPRYRRATDGERKQTHDGWDGRGSADELCMALIDWLAEPEDYVGFDGRNGHAPGQKTPTPMAPIEMTDPDRGRPWRSPPRGYDPWNPRTFAYGSFGAPYGPPDPAPATYREDDRVAGPNDERAMEAAPTPAFRPTTKVAEGLKSVTEALALPANTKVRVAGVIQKSFNGEFGVRLADEQAEGKTLVVQIPSSMRKEFNPAKNPQAIGRRVVVSGKRDAYAGEQGLVTVTKIEFQPAK